MRTYTPKYQPMIKLRIERIKRGLTQKNLSEKAGVNSKLISEYEKGFHKPSLITLKKLAEALNCEVAELIEE